MVTLDFIFQKALGENLQCIWRALYVHRFSLLEIGTDILPTPQSWERNYAQIYILRGGSVFRVFHVFLWLGPSIFSASPMLYPIITKATPAVFFVKKVGKVFHVNLIKFSFFGKKNCLIENKNPVLNLFSAQISGLSFSSLCKLCEAGKLYSIPRSKKGECKSPGKIKRKKMWRRKAVSYIQHAKYLQAVVFIGLG